MTHLDSDESMIGAVDVLGHDEVGADVNNSGVFECESHIIVDCFLQRSDIVGYVFHSLHPGYCLTQYKHF